MSTHKIKKIIQVDNAVIVIYKNGMIEIVSKAAEKVGGVTKLAAAIGIKHNAFYVWKEIPAKRVIAISKATGIPREELRPDLYGDIE